jgi:hypothetical protein
MKLHLAVPGRSLAAGGHVTALNDAQIGTSTTTP